MMTADIRVTEATAIGLLVIASLVAIAARRVRVPYSVALVLVGLAMGFTSVVEVRLTTDIILLVFLPPLLFEGALNLDLAELNRRRLQITALAIIGTLVTAAFIAVPLIFVPGVAATVAMLVAVILAPTDPVSVLATFKDHPVDAGLRTLLEGEAIFNDAFAIVLYVVAVEVAFPKSHHVTVASAVLELAKEVGIGTLVGLALGLAAHWLMSTLDDHLVEIMLSTATAYGTYLAADRLGGSGVLATITAGLMIGNYGTHRSMMPTSRVIMLQFWEVVAFIANSALFLLIGLEFKVGRLFERRTAVAAAVAVGAMFVGRAVIAWGVLSPFRASDRHHTERLGSRIPSAWRGAIFWGGLRGGIPIALVLGLEVTRVAELNIVALVFAVVLVSLIAQGLTFKPLLDRLGLLERDESYQPDEL